MLPSRNKGLGGRTPTIAVCTREVEPFPSRSWEPPCTELGIVHEVATGIERGTIQGADCFPNRNRGLGNLCRPPRLTSSAHLLGDLVMNFTRRTATVGGLSLSATCDAGSLSASSPGFNGSAGSSFAGSTTPTISSALSNLHVS